MRKRKIGLRICGAVLVLALAGPLAGQVVTPDQQQRLYDYFGLNKKFYGLGKKVVENLMEKAPEFFGKYADALAVVNVCNKFANAEDMEAFKSVIDIAESKIIGAIYKPYASVLGWVSWAKTLMEVLNDFVVTPARMDFAMDGYGRSRANGADPEDALSVMRDWGQVEMEMKKAMRAQYGDAIFSEIRPSGMILLPSWQKKLEDFTKGWFEAQYAAKVQREAAEAFARTLGKTLEDLAGYDAQMLQMLKEAQENQPERAYIRPASRTIFVGETASFELVGVLKDGTEDVLVSETFGSGGEFDRTGTTTVELSSSGFSATALIIIIRDETPVSVRFRPESLTVAPGEKADFELQATYEDRRTGIVDIKTAFFDQPGMYPIAGEYRGLTASAVLVVVRSEKPAALFARPESVTVKIGEKTTITCLARYEDGAEETVIVRPVEGRTVGTNRVDFFFLGLSTSATLVTVRDEKPVSLAFTPESITVPPGEQAEFRLRAVFADGKREVVGIQLHSSDKPGSFPVSGEFGGLTASAVLIVARSEKPVALFARPESVSIKVGETATIVGIARYADGAEETVSSAPVTGRTVGTRRIEIFHEGLSAYAEVVTVRDEEPVSLAFTPESITLPPGERAEFRLRAVFADGKREVVGVQYASSDKPGSYPISGEFGGLTAAATLIVIGDEQPESLSFFPQVNRVGIGEGGSFEVRARYPDGRVQMVEMRTFRGYDRPGSYRVTAEFMGLAAEGTILVARPERKADGLSFTPREATLEIGQEITLILRARFEEGGITTTEVVDAIPVVYDKVGTYAVSGSYGGLTATAAITVIKEEQPAEVLVVPPAQTVEIGGRAPFTVVAVYEDGDRVVVLSDEFSDTSRPGTFPIEGVFYGISYSGSVTVVEMRTVESAFLRPESQEVKLGGSASFELVVNYKDGGSAVLKRQTFEGTKVGTQSVFMEAERQSASGWLVVLPLDVEKEEKEEEKEDLEVEDIDKAIKEVKGDEDPCAEAAIGAKSARLTALVGEGVAAASLIDSYHSKFMQIAGAGSGSGGLCGNRMIAYCYANALNNLTALESALKQVEELASEILMLYGICPELAPDFNAAMESVITTIYALRYAGPVSRSKIAAMEARLAEAACDKTEVRERGENDLPANQDPDAVESNANMVGEPGAGGGSCHDWGATAAAAKSNWAVEGQAQGQSGFDLSALRFFGDKDGTVTGTDGARGTYNLIGENIRIRLSRDAVEDGKRVTLTYVFVGTLGAEGRAGGSYTVERNDGGPRQSGSWTVQKRSPR